MKIIANIDPRTAVRLGIAESGRQEITMTAEDLAQMTSEEREVLANSLAGDHGETVMRQGEVDGGHYSAIANIEAPGAAGVIAYIRDLMRRRAEYAAEKAENARQEAIRFGHDATERAERYLAGTAVDFEWPYRPAVWDADLIDRVRAVEATRKAKRAEERKIEEAAAARKAAEAKAAEEAREAAKEAYITAWVAEHGTDSERGRLADGLLCRKEIVARIADDAYSAILTPQSHKKRVCQNSDCACGFSIVDCLGPESYATYRRLVDAGATVDGFERGFDCPSSNDPYDDGNDDDPDPYTLGVVHVQVGPFRFKRTVRLD